MKDKYYTPEIEEFHVGFKCQMKNSSDSVYFEWEDCTFKDDFSNELSEDYCFEYLRTDLKEKNIRVKYLDREDIESCGFVNDKEHAPSLLTFYKITGKEVIQVQPYWHMDMENRENLIRIYKGTLHKYPYTEIFRGDIKNATEFKKLLKQLNIR